MFITVRLVVFKIHVCNSVCLMSELCSYRPFGFLCSWSYSALNVLWCHVNKPCLDQIKAKKQTNKQKFLRSLVNYPDSLLYTSFFEESWGKRNWMKWEESLAADEAYKTILLTYSRLNSGTSWLSARGAYISASTIPHRGRREAGLVLTGVETSVFSIYMLCVIIVISGVCELMLKKKPK